MSSSIRALALSIALLVSSRTSMSAQSTSPTTGSTLATIGELRGRAVNAASRAPVVGATVDVMLAGGTTPVARDVADADGVFRVAGLRPARYRVRVRALGYGPRDLPS